MRRSTAVAALAVVVLVAAAAPAEARTGGLAEETTPGSPPAPPAGPAAPAAPAAPSNRPATAPSNQPAAAPSDQSPPSSQPSQTPSDPVPSTPPASSNPPSNQSAPSDEEPSPPSPPQPPPAPDPVPPPSLPAPPTPVPPAPPAPILAPSDRPPPIGAALGAGGAMALVPLCAGGAMFAGSDDVDVRRGGLYIALAGLTLAPAIAHFVVDEPARAGWFTIAPAVGTGLTVAMLQAYPELLDHGSAPVRVLFGAGLSLAVLGAVVGLADVPGAADRHRRRLGRP